MDVCIPLFQDNCLTVREQVRNHMDSYLESIRHSVSLVFGSLFFEKHHESKESESWQKNNPSERDKELGSVSVENFLAGKLSSKKKKEKPLGNHSALDVDFLLCPESIVEPSSLCSKATLGLLKWHGSIAGRALVFHKEDMNFALKCLKEDISHSILTRLELFYEDLERNEWSSEESNESSVNHPFKESSSSSECHSMPMMISWKLPRRVLLSMCNAHLQLSDYMFEYETIEDIKLRISEMLGIGVYEEIENFSQPNDEFKFQEEKNKPNPKIVRSVSCSLVFPERFPEEEELNGQHRYLEALSQIPQRKTSDTTNIDRSTTLQTRNFSYGIIAFLISFVSSLIVLLWSIYLALE